MADVQTENAFITIATELVEALANIRISGEEYQCLWVIIRKTYGWKKKMDWIALSQFQEMTGIAKPSIVRALGKLVAKNIIYKKVNAYGVSYGIQKNYSKWKPLTKKLTVNKKATGVDKKVNLGVTKKLPTKDTTTKETITIEIPGWIPKKEWDAYAEMRIEKKFPLTNGAVTVAINKLKKLKGEGSNPKDVLENSVLCGYRGLFPSKSNGKDREYAPTSKQPCKVCSTTEWTSLISGKCEPCRT